MREYYSSEWLPYALVLGISDEKFWDMNPRLLRPYEKAFEIKRNMADEDMWMIGNYITNAVYVGVSKAVWGKKSNAEYLKKPFHEMKPKNPPKEAKKEMTEAEKREATDELFEMFSEMEKNFDRSKGN